MIERINGKLYVRCPNNWEEGLVANVIKADSIDARVLCNKYNPKIEAEETVEVPQEKVAGRSVAKGLGGRVIAD